MINIDIADNNIKQMLYVFRYFYSNAFKFNIMMHSEDWDIPDNVKNSDIIGLLKKDIRSLKYKYIPEAAEEELGKINYVEGKFEELYKLKFDNSSSLSGCFYIAYKTIKVLIESKNYLILKWFVVSFFEKYLPVVFKAYDIYTKGQNEIVLGVKDNLNGISDLTKEIIRKDLDSMALANSFHLLCKYILSINKDNKYVDINVLKYCYERYLLYKDEKNEEAAKAVENDNIEYLNNVVKNTTNISDNMNNVVLFGDLRCLSLISDKNKLINVIKQTIKVVKENEGENITFNIDEDFAMYFIVNEDDFRPIYLKSEGTTYTIINYDGNMYLLYMNGTKNVYGSALVSWFNDPNSIIKISPDDAGEFKFIINDIKIDD